MFVFLFGAAANASEPTKKRLQSLRLIFPSTFTTRTGSLAGTLLSVPFGPLKLLRNGLSPDCHIQLSRGGQVRSYKVDVRDFGHAVVSLRVQVIHQRRLPALI